MQRMTRLTKLPLSILLICNDSEPAKMTLFTLCNLKSRIKKLNADSNGIVNTRQGKAKHKQMGILKIFTRALEMVKCLTL